MATDQLSRTFAALADPTRRAILARLMTGQATVTELAAPFSMSGPAVSKHLKVLEAAGLIVKGRVAQSRPRQLVPAPLEAAATWIETYSHFWGARFDRLEAALKDLHGPGTS